MNRVEQVLKEMLAELIKIRELLEPRQVTATIGDQDIQYLRRSTDESLTTNFGIVGLKGTND